MDAEDVSVALKEQDDNDSSFLQKICSTYGLILKHTGTKSGFLTVKSTRKGFGSNGKTD